MDRCNVRKCSWSKLSAGSKPDPLDTRLLFIFGVLLMCCEISMLNVLICIVESGRGGNDEEEGSRTLYSECRYFISNYNITAIYDLTSLYYL